MTEYAHAGVQSDVPFPTEEIYMELIAHPLHGWLLGFVDIIFSKF